MKLNKNIFIALIFLSISSQAFIERQFSVLGITHPQGISLGASLAYNYELWRDSEENFWKYGFIRPKLSFDSSIMVNTFSGEVQVYPISLLGFAVGTAYTDRQTKKLKEFDCDQVDCQGTISRFYIKSSVLLGYQRFKMAYFFQRDFINTSHSDKSMAELNTFLLIKSGTSTLDRQTLFMGFDIGNNKDLGVLYLTGTVDQARSVNQYLIMQHRRGQWKGTAGLGTFESDYVHRDFSAIVKVSWSMDPSLSLTD